MDFKLDKEQMKQVREWWMDDKHLECRNAGAGSIGGKLSYIFTPTSIGVLTQVECGICLDTIDVSDV